MSERRPEVADVLASFAAPYRASFSPGGDQERVLRELPLCRTAALGGHKLECDRCGHQEISYNVRSNNGSRCMQRGNRLASDAVQPTRACGPRD